MSSIPSIICRGGQDPGAQLLVQPFQPRGRVDDVAHGPILKMVARADVAQRDFPAMQTQTRGQSHLGCAAIERIDGIDDVECCVASRAAQRRLGSSGCPDGQHRIANHIRDEPSVTPDRLEQVS